jgi:hypothetical protein
MANNGGVLLDGLSNLIVKLRHERDDIEKQLNQLDEEIRAVETTISLYRKAGKIHEPEAYKSIVPELQGRTHIDALRHIASRSGGRLKVTDAKRLMSEAGLIRNPKNALSMLYTIISRSGEFERIAPGEYRLISHVQQKFTYLDGRKNSPISNLEKGGK